jgi:hypothetical protein
MKTLLKTKDTAPERSFSMVFARHYKFLEVPETNSRIHWILEFQNYEFRIAGRRSIFELFKRKFKYIFVFSKPQVFCWERLTKISSKVEPIPFLPRNIAVARCTLTAHFYYYLYCMYVWSAGEVSRAGGWISLWRWHGPPSPTPKK